MSRAAHALSEEDTEAFVEATVLAAGSPRVRVALEDGRALEATAALALDYRAAPGDRVLVARSGERAWIIGVISALRTAPEAPRAAELRTRDGVSASIDEDAQVLTVRADDGAVLFTHCARRGESTVRASGALRVRADGGDLHLEAERAVRIEAGDEVRVAVNDENSLSVSARGTEVRAERLHARIGEGRFSVRDALFAAARFESAIEKARSVVGVAELRAGRLVERVGDVFREVEGLSQTRAERIRLVARDAYQLLANRATLKAEDDLALMGEKIHLS